MRSSNGNGTIDAEELENAVREHRRFRWLRSMIERHERTEAEATRNAASPSPNTSSGQTQKKVKASSSSVVMVPNDPRRCFTSLVPLPRALPRQSQPSNPSSFAESGSGGGGGGGGGLPPSKLCSLPLVGQKLMAMQLRPATTGSGGASGARTPCTVWQIQAEKAMEGTMAVRSRADADLYRERDARRQRMLEATKAKQETRRALEEKARRG